MLRYALTILLSAFLLFQIQPLIARYILPWFGGTPAVWTTCLLFFQFVLLLGYLYAHLMSTKLSTRAQSVLHASLLLASLALLPTIPSGVWKPEGDESPALRILSLLFATVGVPYLLLSSTGPLVQRWFSLSWPGVSPYRLYALSNAGSLAALLTYPVLFEPIFRLGMQTWMWAAGYGVFALLCASCAWQIFRQSPGKVPESPTIPDDTTSPSAPETESEQTSSEESSEWKSPSWVDILMWLGLAAFPSVLLLAATNQLCQDVAVVPFLWVLPLSLYLLSFVIAFDSPRWYKRFLWFSLMLGGTLAVVYCLVTIGNIPFGAIVLAYSCAVLGCAMCCHGELSIHRPAVRSLTLFYLCIAAGGVLGGLFVALVAPRIFTHFWELQVGLLGSIGMAFIAYRRKMQGDLAWQYGAAVVVAIATLGLSAYWGWNFEQLRQRSTDTVVRERNFYGVLIVDRSQTPWGELYQLMHGTVCHGQQFRDPDKQDLRTGYYSEESGVGAALKYHPRRLSTDEGQRTLRVGIVGLGTGTLAAWGEAGDVFRFYEINPAVRRIAEDYFTFCENSPAQVEIVLGDARIQMEQELAAGGSQQYDILVIDAFSGDAIPMHLLTQECFELYWKHLRPDGILAIHTTNHFLNLLPIPKSLAEENDYTPLLFEWKNEMHDPVSFESQWVLITRNEEFLNNRDVKRRDIPWPTHNMPELVWTDDFGSLWQVLK